MHLILGTVKLTENSTSLNDDVNAYTFIGSYEIMKDTVVGLDLTYADGQNLAHDSSFGLSRINDPSLHLWNLGLNGKTRIVGLGIAGDLDLQSVKVNDLDPRARPTTSSALGLQKYIWTTRSTPSL